MHFRTKDSRIVVQGNRLITKIERVAIIIQNTVKPRERYLNTVFQTKLWQVQKFKSKNYYMLYLNTNFISYCGHQFSLTEYLFSPQLFSSFKANSLTSKNCLLIPK